MAASSDDEDEHNAYPKDLYATLGLKKEDSPTRSEIKKAYHRFALKLHPDKNPSKDASKQFQTLQKVYAVLSDEKKRKVRTITYSDTKELGGRKVPTKMTLRPLLKEGHETVIVYDDLAFDVELPDNTFTVTNLRRGR